MGDMSVGDWIGVVSILLTVGGFLVAATVGVTKIRTVVSEENAKMRITLAEEIAKVRKDMDSEFDAHKVGIDDAMRAMERSFGETVNGLKEHVRLFELWARDHLVRRDSFKDIITEIRNENREWRQNLQESIKRIENLLTRHP